VWTTSVNLVNNVLHADNAIFAKVLLDDCVVSEGNALFVNLSKSTLVYKLSDGLQVGVSIGDEGLCKSEHVDGGLVQAKEHSVIELSQTQELQHFSGLGTHTKNTTKSEHKCNFGLGLYIEVSTSSGLSPQSDKLFVFGTVLVDVLLSLLDSKGLARVSVSKFDLPLLLKLGESLLVGLALL